MHRCICALTVALAVSVVVAQEGDRLQSADCRKALDALQTQEDAAAALPRSGSQIEGHEHRNVAGLKTARHRAAIACLGGRADSPPPSGRFAQPPITVVPITIAPPAASPQVPAGPVLTLPKKVEPPTMVTVCDPLGCWASDGSRLPRVGPNLLGPRGLCSGQGVLLHCP